MRPEAGAHLIPLLRSSDLRTKHRIVSQFENQTPSTLRGSAEFGEITVEPNEDNNSERETEIEKRTLLLMKHMEHSAGESDRGYVLFLAAQMDIYLREVLESFLVKHSSVTELFDGPYAPFGSFSGKIKAAFVLGLITREEAARVDAVRKVRNVFAHVIDATFDSAEIKKLCAKPPIYDGRLSDRDAFFHMGMNATLPLLYRSVMVKLHWRRSELTAQSISDLESIANLNS